MNEAAKKPGKIKHETASEPAADDQTDGTPDFGLDIDVEAGHLVLSVGDEKLAFTPGAARRFAKIFRQQAGRAERLHRKFKHVAGVDGG